MLHFTRAMSMLILLGMIAVIWMSVEIGRRFRLRFPTRIPESRRNVHSAIQTSIFGLLALLIAFTFYGAASRFDIRRNLIVAEANAISTAYLRLDLLPPETQPRLRENFRSYVRSRIETSRKIPDIDAVVAELARSSKLQTKIWNEAVESVRTSTPSTQSLVLSSINTMIDATTPRTAALTAHPPVVIFLMLGLTVVVSSLLMGYSASASSVREWPFTLCFAFVLGATLYVILDYEFPGVGFIRIDPVEQILVDALAKMR